MDIILNEINVTLSEFQKKKIHNAFINREKILIKLKNENLLGSDTLLVPSKSLNYTENEKSIVIEKLKNGTLYEDSKTDETTDEMMEKYGLFFIPTVVEKLEKTRKTYKGMEIILDYSLMTDLIKDSVLNNIKNLFN